MTDSLLNPVLFIKQELLRIHNLYTDLELDHNDGGTSRFQVEDFPSHATLKLLQKV